MKSTTSIILNLQVPNYSVAVYAVQGDVMSREINATLLDGSTPWTPPAGAIGSVRYMKPDGTSGFYTEDEEHNPAVVWVGNVATIRLAQQALTVAGEVIAQVSFYSEAAERLSAFNFRMIVERNPISDQEFESTDYYSVLSQQIAAVLDVNLYPPRINSLNHWEIYDPETHLYYDSGVNAQGVPGPEGPAGPQGISVSSVTKESGSGAAGTRDVYDVNLSDGTVAGTFDVYNGQDGQGAPGSADPLMDGIASPGVANGFSREDHVHPSDTSRQAKNKYFTNVSVAASAFSSNSTYADYSYRATIPLTGVTSDMWAVVAFAPAQADSGNYAPVCQTYNGGVYIYSKINSAITIPTITVME